MVTLPCYLIYMSSPTKDLQEKNYTQKVRESAFIEKEEQQIIKEKFLFLQKERIGFSQKGEKTTARRARKCSTNKN